MGNKDLEIITFGCRLNAHESEIMRDHAGEAGLENTVIINSCAVTVEAVRQVRQTIRRIRKDRPDARILVTGCAAQIDPQQFAQMDEVDHVIGNHDKVLPETFQTLATTDSPRIIVNDIMSVRETAHHMIAGFGSRARAYVEIQNGCDHRCTFCIIPFGRGQSRSHPAGEVVAQIRSLCEKGFQEIVLTGVDITAYGNDLPGRMSLGSLVQKILNLVPELPRLRLSSIDSVEVDDALMDVIATEKRLMPHLHLSLQSGDDLILKRMKRRHLRDHSLRFCDQVRKARPDMVFGADLIAGFPTESDEMFANTFRLIEDCGLTYLHVFPFSPRPGTPAARMPLLDRSLIKERAGVLRQAGQIRLQNFLAHQAGKMVDVLVEKESLGRTEQFAEVSLATPQATGSIVATRITGNDMKRLSGEVVQDVRQGATVSAHG